MTNILKDNNITITEVSVSPDLKNAKVYVMPLGGKNKSDVLNSLNKVTGRIKKIISNNISLRQTPKIFLKLMKLLNTQKTLTIFLKK